MGSVPVCLFLSGSFCVRLAALRRAPRLRCALRIFDTVRHLALRRMCVAAVVRGGGGGGGGGGGVSEDYVLQVSRPEKAKQIVFCFEGECVMGGEEDYLWMLRGPKRPQNSCGSRGECIMFCVADSSAAFLALSRCERPFARAASRETCFGRRVADCVNNSCVLSCALRSR